jgi:hypothetical protein
MNCSSVAARTAASTSRVKRRRVQVAVVAVAAAVDPWVDELRRQVAVAGDHFHAVEPGLMRRGGGGVAGDDLVDQRRSSSRGTRKRSLGTAEAE